jgi:hypothetical protein
MGTGKFVDGAGERWKPNVKVLRAVTQYVKDTKRFQARAMVMEGTGAVEKAGETENGERDEVGGSL